MAYADGFLIPLQKKNLAAYRKMSEKAGKVWMEYGALDYKECAGDDFTAPVMMTSFPKLLKLKRGETLVFSWIVYKDKAQRDAVNKKIMTDPRLKTPKVMPFDLKRMVHGGFDVIVDFTQAKRAPAKKARRKARA